ncbi:MAG TPA: hypothetical protein VN753_06090 [Terracidiphilus sp.]|nr:hypothetical protein [Terracidiphilus sp.]
MSPSSENRSVPTAGALTAEETLRLIATLPAPEELENRVKAKLQSAPHRRNVIVWPFAAADSWMRAAAAAAIVVVIAGGGWGVYSHIQVAPVPSAVVEPQPLNGAGRFSTAGAMHVPQTVQGPVVATPVIEKEHATDQVPRMKEKAHKRGTPSSTERKRTK